MCDRRRLVGACVAIVAAVTLNLTVKAAAPAAPVNLTASVTGLTVTLNWTRADTGDPASSFLVEAGSASGASDVFAGNVGNITTLVASAPAGTYFVRVRGVNADGVSATSNQVVVTVGLVGPCIPLSPPGSFSGAVALPVITLTWSASPNATSYLLDAGTAPGLSNVFTGDVGNATALTTPAPAGTYFVRIRSRNACGTSAPSGEIVISVGATALIGTLTDPVGDVAAGSPDLVAAAIAVVGSTLELTIQFTQGTFDRTPPSVGVGGTLVHVSLDTDGNPLTGNRGSDSTCIADNGILGTEYAISFGPGDDGGIRVRVLRFVGPNCNQFLFAGFTAPGSVTVNENSVRAIVPLSMLGDDDGRLAFKVSTTRALGGGVITGILDKMSNTGLPPGRVPNP